MNQPQHPGHPYPQQPGVNPQTGWPQQQAQPQGHPPQQQPQGYPPQQPQGYPPQQAQQPQGYPPQQPQGYPPQQAQQPQGYPPQQAQQPQGYPPQQQQPQQGYPQQQPGFPPQQQQGYGQPQAGMAAQAYGGMQQPQAQFNDTSDTLAAEASPEARAKFIERTYLHLAGAIFLFVILSAGLQVMPGIEALVGKMIQSRASWGVVLVLFMGTSWIADRWAQNSTSQGMQYAGLGLYVLVEVIIFVPLLYIARMVLGGAEPIIMAGGATLAMFAAMTAYVFITKKDFSFMRGALSVLTMAAVGLVVGSLVFGFSLGIVFSVAMIALASGYILFYTSNIIKHYRVDQHVAAALALFSAVALLFWYMIRLLMSLRN